MSRRTERVNALIQEDLSELIAREVKDPRITGIISITKVEVSPDLRHAQVDVSTLGDEAEQKALLTALQSAAPFLRRELNRRLTMRYTPALSFRLDDSIRRGAELLALMHNLNTDEERTP